MWGNSRTPLVGLLRREDNRIMPVKCLLQCFCHIYRAGENAFFCKYSVSFFFFPYVTREYQEWSRFVFYFVCEEMLLNLFLRMFELNSLCLRVIFLSYVIALWTSSKKKEKKRKNDIGRLRAFFLKRGFRALGQNVAWNGFQKRPEQAVSVVKGPAGDWHIPPRAAEVPCRAHAALPTCADTCRRKGGLSGKGRATPMGYRGDHIRQMF